LFVFLFINALAEFEDKPARPDVKNPVFLHGASSKEKAILIWGLCGFGP